VKGSERGQAVSTTATTTSLGRAHVDPDDQERREEAGPQVAANLPYAVSQSQAELAIVSRKFLRKMTTYQRSRTAVQTTRGSAIQTTRGRAGYYSHTAKRGFRYPVLARSDF